MLCLDAAKETANEQVGKAAEAALSSEGEDSAEESEDEQYASRDDTGREAAATTTTAKSHESYADYLVGWQRMEDYIAEDYMLHTYVALTGISTTTDSYNGNPWDLNNYYTVHFYYRRLHLEAAMHWENIVDEILICYMGVLPSSLRVVSIPTGITKANIIFNTEQAYDFWCTSRATTEWQESNCLHHFHLQPLF